MSNYKQQIDEIMSNFRSLSKLLDAKPKTTEDMPNWNMATSAAAKLSLIKAESHNIKSLQILSGLGSIIGKIDGIKVEINTYGLEQSSIVESERLLNKLRTNTLSLQALVGVELKQAQQNTEVPEEGPKVTM